MDEKQLQAKMEQKRQEFKELDEKEKQFKQALEEVKTQKQNAVGAFSVLQELLSDFQKQETKEPKQADKK